jgi:hypothetical protein
MRQRAAGSRGYVTWDTFRRCRGMPSRSRGALLTTGALTVVLAVLSGPALLAPTLRAPGPSLSGSTVWADPSDMDPQDYLDALSGMTESIIADRPDMARCPELAGGTAGGREVEGAPPREPDHGNPKQAGDEPVAPASLPKRVDLRGTRQTYNRRYEFVVARGTVFYRSRAAVTGIHEPWDKLDVPGCIDGRIAMISADDDEMVVVDEDRWVYTLDGILSDPAYFTWTMRWGPPFWTGSGRRLPLHIRTWSWSVLSQLEDGTWRDAAGNDHAVGDFKVSHIWTLGRDGRRLTYLDPWLPRDSSYEMCAPHRGRFRSAGMSASGSTVFVIGRYGDMFTRLYDFDISGADSVFFDYSYDDQRGRPDPAIQLPSPAWREQPKIPGVVTDRISIEKVGASSLHRTLRVEGRRDKRRGSRTGYWQKDLTARRWRFVPTGEPLRGHLLRNPPRDTSGRGLLRSEARRYVGAAGTAELTIPDFDVSCSPAHVRVWLATGQRFTMRLHTVDAIRQDTRARGLDAEPRLVQGVLEVPARLLRSKDPDVRAFLDSLGPRGRFVDADLDATVTRLGFRDQGWTFRRR